MTFQFKFARPIAFHVLLGLGLLRGSRLVLVALALVAAVVNPVAQKVPEAVDLHRVAGEGRCAAAATFDRAGAGADHLPRHGAEVHLHVACGDGLAVAQGRVPHLHDVLLGRVLLGLAHGADGLLVAVRAQEVDRGSEVDPELERVLLPGTCKIPDDGSRICILLPFPFVPRGLSLLLCVLAALYGLRVLQPVLLLHHAATTPPLNAAASLHGLRVLRDGEIQSSELAAHALLGHTVDLRPVRTH